MGRASGPAVRAGDGPRIWQTRTGAFGPAERRFAAGEVRVERHEPPVLLGPRHQQPVRVEPNGLCRIDLGFASPPNSSHHSISVGRTMTLRWKRRPVGRRPIVIAQRVAIGFLDREAEGRGGRGGRDRGVLGKGGWDRHGERKKGEEEPVHEKESGNLKKFARRRLRERQRTRAGAAEWQRGPPIGVPRACPPPRRPARRATRRRRRGEDHQAPAGADSRGAAVARRVGRGVGVAFKGPVARDDELLDRLVPVGLVGREVAFEPRAHRRLPDVGRLVRGQVDHVVRQHAEKRVQVIGIDRPDVGWVREVGAGIGRRRGQGVGRRRRGAVRAGTRRARTRAGRGVEVGSWEKTGGVDGW